MLEGSMTRDLKAAWIHSCARCGHAYGDVPSGSQECPDCGSLERAATPRQDAPDRSYDPEAVEALMVAVEAYIAYDAEHQRRIDTSMLSRALDGIRGASI